MEKDSLGLIETSGLVAAIEAADAGSKAANVTFRGYQRARAGLITVVFLGDVAAVRAAVTAGSAAAKRVGTVISVHVIARPDLQLRIVSNGAQPVEKLVPLPRAKPIVPGPPRQVEVEPAPVEAPHMEESVPSLSTSGELPQIPQTQPAPELPLAQICDEPAVEEHFHEENNDAETVIADAYDDGHLVLEEEPEEEVVVAARVSAPHKKEKVRKPRSKRKA